MAATHTTDSTISNAPVLYLALDLGTRDWKLAFTVGLGQKPRLKMNTARSTASLLAQIQLCTDSFASFWTGVRRSRAADLSDAGGLIGIALLGGLYQRHHTRLDRCGEFVPRRDESASSDSGLVADSVAVRGRFGTEFSILDQMSVSARSSGSNLSIADFPGPYSFTLIVYGLPRSGQTSGIEAGAARACPRGIADGARADFAAGLNDVARVSGSGGFAQAQRKLSAASRQSGASHAG
jgi:hypothetical protein